MKGITISPLWKTIAIILVLLVLFIVLSNFAFNWVSLLGLIPEEATLELQKPDATTYFDFQSLAGLSPEPYMLDRYDGMSSASISVALTEKDTVTNCGNPYYDLGAPHCTGCSECTTVTLDSSDPTSTSTSCMKCDNCQRCGEVSWTGRFNRCGACNGCIGTDCANCFACEDNETDYALCSSLKNCIRTYDAYDGLGCEIATLNRAEGGKLNISELYDILRQCKEGPIETNAGGGKMKEVCYFKTSDMNISRLYAPDNFYPVKKYCAAGTYDFEDPQTIAGIDCQVGYLNYDYSKGTLLYQVDIDPVLVYKSEFEELTENYGLYVTATVPSASSTEFDAPIYVLVQEGPLYNYDFWYEVGSVHFNAGQTISSAYLPWPEKWKIDAKDNAYKIVVEKIGAGSFLNGLFVELRSRDVGSNEEYANDLEWHNCNPVRDISSAASETDLSVFHVWPFPETWTPFPVLDKSLVFDNYTATASAESTERGQIRIVMGDLKTEPQRECIFDTYVCSQDSFAENLDDSTIKIKELFTTFDAANDPKKVVSSASYDVVKYNYYELQLDRPYTPEEITTAIETGFQEWAIDTLPQLGIDYIGHMHNSGPSSGWNVQESGGAISYDRDCRPEAFLDATSDSWNVPIRYPPHGSDTRREIFYYCSGGDCEGKLKIRIYFLRPYQTGNDPWLKPLYPMITFCSSG